MKEDCRRQVINRLKGLTATLYNFTTDPTNLANITDEDWTTVSGTGVRICSGANEIAQLHYDLGAVRTVLLVAKVGLWASTGTISFIFLFSLDGITWVTTSGLNQIQISGTSESVRYAQTVLVRARYIGARILNGTAGATMSAKFYEFAALEFRDFIGTN